jgi:hypothetical protein
MYLLTYQDSTEPLFITKTKDKALEFADEWTGANDKYPKSTRISYTELNFRKTRATLHANISYMFNSNDMDCINYTIWKLDEE